MSTASSLPQYKGPSVGLDQKAQHAPGLDGASAFIEPSVVVDAV